MNIATLSKIESKYIYNNTTIEEMVLKYTK